MPSKLTENSVLGKIERVFPASRHVLMPLGLNDDTALVRPRQGYETLLTVDWFLEGTHFLRDKHSADSVGWKCFSRAASDIAAMGGTPLCFLLSIALPASCTGAWLNQFLRGLKRSSQALGCALAGGDTTCRDEILISVTVVGEAAADRAVTRSNAKPGDLLYVSGTLGEADLGLRQLRAEPGIVRPTTLGLRKHLYPQARIALGQWLAKKRLATSMMDISDGLSTDLPRLCAASKVGARIEASALPRAVGTSGVDGLALALNGGDDYELLFTVSPKNARNLPKAFGALKLTRIGEIQHGHKLVVRNENGTEKPLQPAGWDPFRPAK
jgi:thiamine-monophosphate kinase